jgi:hypothetical protein
MLLTSAYLVVPVMLLRRHALAVAAVHVEGAAVMDVAASARVAAPAPAPLAARARLPAVPAAAFPGLAACVVTGGDGFQALAVLRHPLAHALRHPLHLHPQRLNLEYAEHVAHAQ